MEDEQHAVPSMKPSSSTDWSGQYLVGGDRDRRYQARGDRDKWYRM